MFLYYQFSDITWLAIMTYKITHGPGLEDLGRLVCSFSGAFIVCPIGRGSGLM
jgi:hypothetical protein